jgi:hypothetical protein
MSSAVRITLIFLVLSFVLSGCFAVTDESFYLPRFGVEEDAIVGEWRQSGSDDGNVIIEEMERGKYLMTSMSGAEGSYELRFMDINGRRILEAKFRPEQTDLYVIAKYELSDSSFSFWAIRDKWLAENSPNIKYREIDGEQVITTGKNDLISEIAKHFFDEKLFEDPIVLIR